MSQGETLGQNGRQPGDTGVPTGQDAHGTDDHRDAGPLADSRGEAAAPDGEPEEEGSETVQDAAKLVRLSRMLGELLGELREAELDAGTVARLRAHVEQTANEVGDALSPDLHDELKRLRSLWTDESGVSQAELRIEQAQLAGWLEGVLQGIQNALAAEQASEQQHEGGPPGPFQS